MELFLQLWGGGCYLLNKAGFALAANQLEARQRRFKIFAWSVYILGVPAWVIILVSHGDWIAAAMEAGGVPAMLLGLYIAIYQPAQVPRRFNQFVSFVTYGSIVCGVGYSVIDHSGLTSLTQWLEMGVMVGFLMGNYWLAKGQMNGWLMFMLMNVSMATLMWVQGQTILTLQQLLSLGFVLYGYRNARIALNTEKMA